MWTCFCCFRVNYKCLPCCLENMASIYLTVNETSDCCHCDKDIGKHVT